MRAPKDTKLREWQKKNWERRDTCPKCLRQAEMTIDHVIPVHILEQLGLFDETLNWEENFELVCLTCNKFKGGRIDMANKKTVPLLKEIISKLEKND